MDYALTVLASGADREAAPESAAPPPEPAVPHLVILEGGSPGEPLRLEPRGTRLGRAPENTVTLHEPSVSRHHAFFWVDEAGDAHLTDQGSSNGTLVDGRPVPRHGSVRLRPGDQIRFGRALVARFSWLDPNEERCLREVYDRSVRDPLTRLHNRSYFLLHAGYKIHQDPQGRLGMAVLLLDIDHFKRVNDTFGHDAGDLVLRHVADVLVQSIRPGDLLARYGGEEFVLALSVPGIAQAIIVAERIRAGIAARAIPAKGESLRVTASLGASFAPPGAAGSVADLISAADRCLYQAKSEGRDRVVSGP